MPGRLLVRLRWPSPRPACPPSRCGHVLDAYRVAGSRGLGVVASPAAAGTPEQPAPSERLSYLHNPGSAPLMYITYGELAARAARRYAQRDAVVSLEEGVRLSYRELLDKADRLAAGLRRLGLQPGDRVAIWAPNSWRWVVAKIALGRVGMVAVYLNPMYREQEVQHCLSLARVAAVVAAHKHGDCDYHGMLSKVAPELPRSDPRQIKSASLPYLKVVVTMADSALPGCVNFDDVISSASPEEVLDVKSQSAAVNPDTASCIQFSSGTTGKPKAIVIPHVGEVNNGYCNGRRFGMDEQHHSICLQPPLFHAFGSVVITSTAMNHGATIVLPTSGYNPSTAIQASLSEKCTVMTGTPTMYVDLVRALEKESATLDSLQLAVTGGAPITPELVRRMKHSLGVHRVCSVYGLSETSAVVFQGTKDDTLEQTCGTVGRLSEHIEAKVVDADNRLVPFGTPGELLVRGYCNMREYFQNEEATRKTLVDGWVRTGDKFVLEEDGFGRIVGRIKDMVIRGGENIYPKEVEDALTLHPDVREAEVVGVPDERMGEELCACLKVRDGAKISASDLRTFLLGKIAKFKIPRYCVTLPDFPKTQSGKIQKYKLRETCSAMLATGGLDDSRAQPSQ